MPWLEAGRQALHLLWAHKVRSLLTMFGIVWGTAAVILLVSWGDGVSVTIEHGFFKAGKNMGEVWAGRVSEDFTPAVDRRYLWYEYEDVQVLRRRARLPTLVGAEAWRMLPAGYRQRAVTVDVRGIEPQVMEIRGVPLAAGRGISPSDVDHRRRVVVLGDTVRRRLLGAEGRIGSWVRIGGKPFQVIGFLEHVGTQLSRDRMLIDEHAWIPITTVQANWPQPWTDEFVISKILYRMPDPERLDDTEREVRAILAGQLRVAPDDDEAVVIHSAVRMLRRLPLAQTRGVMFVLATATLVIGGIGILTMMLDSVFERRQEIGVRLAVGARRRDVVAQFFLETLTITALGGAAGVGLGIGACAFLAGLDVPDVIPVPILSPGTVALAVAVMTGVGLAAGVIPAWRAARVDPALTLRMD
jgi:putative ABC transport system permease protein